MKLGTAIEVLICEVSDIMSFPDPDLSSALDLGIEALQHIAALRVFPQLKVADRLPGETED